MSERYSRLFSLEENLYTEGAPIMIVAGALLKDNQNGTILAQLKFKNISTKPITSVKVSIRAFDVVGKEIEGVNDYQYLDLLVKRDDEFGQKKAIPMPSQVTRAFSCVCTHVVFKDGSIWEANNAEQKPIEKAETLFKRLGNLADQYVRDTNSQAKYVVTQDRDLWQCTCGAINRMDEATCHSCFSPKEVLISKLNTKSLEEHKKAFDKAAAEERAIAEEQERIKKAELEQKLAKAKKIGIICGSAAVALLLVILLITKVIVPFVQQKQEEAAIRAVYEESVAYMEEGNYDAAIEGFKSIPDYNDAEALLESCYAQQELLRVQGLYDEATRLMETEQYEEASAIFGDIMDYEDAAERYAEARYNYADQLVEEGNYNLAIAEFRELGAYQDSAQRIEETKDLQVQNVYELVEAGRYTEAQSAYWNLEDYSVEPLNEADFILEEPYEFYGHQDLTEALQQLNSDFGWVYYDPDVDESPESVIATARDIQIGDHMLEVQLSYGQGKQGEVTSSTYFYKKIDPDLQSRVGEDCKTYLAYEFGEYGLYFFFDGEEKVTFIAFSYRQDLTAKVATSTSGASAYGPYGGR